MRTELAALVTMGMCLATGQVRGQEIVTVGTPEVRPSRTWTGVDSFDLMVAGEAGGNRTASVTRRLSIVDWGGERAFLLVQRYRSPEGAPTNADSSWVRTEDLAPLAYRASVGNEVHAFEFSPDGARGTISTPDSSRSIFDPEAAGAFNSVMGELAIAGLPLRVGLTRALKLYNPGRGATVARISVEGLDTLGTGEGAVQAWRVRYDTGPVSWFWFDRSSHRFLRSRTELRNGRSFWRVRTEDVEAWRTAGADRR